MLREAATAAMTVNPLSASTDSPSSYVLNGQIMALSPRDPLNGFVGELSQTKYLRHHFHVCNTQP